MRYSTGAVRDYSVVTQRILDAVSVHLHVDARHDNGGSFIDAYDDHETAAFALELKPSP